MENIKFKENFNNCRTSIYKPETRQFLLSRIAGSEQETDMSVPSNCDGFGRIHHFRRNVDKWVQDPLPNDPVCKALEIPYTDVLEAQVFQIASCNAHCWYCFVPDELKRGKMVNAKWLTAEQMVELYKKSDTDIRVIDLSGGNPELAPEWTLDTMKALERNATAFEESTRVFTKTLAMCFSSRFVIDPFHFWTDKLESWYTAS